MKRTRMGVMALERLHADPLAVNLDPSLIPHGDEGVAQEVADLDKYLPQPGSQTAVVPPTNDTTPVPPAQGTLATEANGEGATDPKEIPAEIKKEEGEVPPAAEGDAPAKEGGDEGAAEVDPATEPAATADGEPATEGDVTDPAADPAGDPAADPNADPAADPNALPGAEAEPDPATAEIKLPDLNDLEVDKVAAEIERRQDEESEEVKDALGEGEILIQSLEAMGREILGGKVLSQERLQVLSDGLQEIRGYLGAEDKWVLGMEGYQEGQTLTQELVMEGFMQTLVQIWKAALAFLRRILDNARTNLKVWYQGIDRELELTRQLTRKLTLEVRRNEENSDLGRNLALVNTEQYVSLPVASRFLTLEGGQPAAGQYAAKFEEFMVLARSHRLFSYYLDPNWTKQLREAFGSLVDGNGLGATSALFSNNKFVPPEFNQLQAKDFEGLVLQRDEILVGLTDMLGDITFAQVIVTRGYATSEEDRLKTLERWRCVSQTDDSVSLTDTGSLRRLDSTEVNAISGVIVKMGAEMKNYYGLDRGFKGFEERLNATQQVFTETATQGSASPEVIAGLNATVIALSAVSKNMQALADAYPRACLNLMRAYNAYLKALIVRDEQVKAEFQAPRDPVKPAPGKAAP